MRPERILKLYKECAFRQKPADRMAYNFSDSTHCRIKIQELIQDGYTVILNNHILIIHKGDFYIQSQLYITRIEACMEILPMFIGSDPFEKGPNSSGHYEYFTTTVTSGLSLI